MFTTKIKTTPICYIPSSIRSCIPHEALEHIDDGISVLVMTDEFSGKYYYGEMQHGVAKEIDYSIAYAMAGIVLSANGTILKNRYQSIEHAVKYDIYIAGSFGTPEERSELELMVSFVKREHPNSTIFVPMEHFIPGGNDKNEYGNYIMPNEEWGKRVFEMDLAALKECHTVYNLYRGHISGSGTAWELGYAYATNKRIVQYIPSNVEDVSVMCYNCANEHVNSNKVNQK